MNKGMLAVGIILLSLIALLMINVLTNMSTGSELDYYLVKETADAAALDAIDKTYLRTCGLIRMNKEKFVESFIYRFANSIDGTRDYDIKFYDINEVPPKASIKVDSLTVLAVKSIDANGDEKKEAGVISTSYDLIVETNYLDNFAVQESINSKNSKNFDSCVDYTNDQVYNIKK